ncbi:MAG: hypothetical protein EHM18_18515 [Acidobacteria bacterium]|nr:MAG: hypothetical protein EHM18_18515 [Acidobacteriota bacterium]
MRGNQRSTLCLVFFVFLAAFWLLDSVEYIEKLPGQPLDWARAKLVGGSWIPNGARASAKLQHEPPQLDASSVLGLTSEWQRVATISPGEAEETLIYARQKGGSVDIIIVGAGEQTVYF